MGGCEWHRVDGDSSRVLGAVGNACASVEISWSTTGRRALLVTSSGMWAWTGAALEKLPPDRGGTLIRARIGDDGAVEVERADISAESVPLTDRISDAIGRAAPANTSAPPKLIYKRLAYRLEDGEWVETDSITRDVFKGETLPDVDLGEFPRLRPFIGEPVSGDPALTEALMRIGREIALETLAAGPLPALPPGTRLLRTKAGTRMVRPAPRKGSPPPPTPSPTPADALEAYEQHYGRLWGEEWIWRAVTFPDGITLARRADTMVFVQNAVAKRPVAMPDVDALWIRDGLVLATARDGATPRVYDLRTGALLWKSDTAEGATFWPMPATP